MSLEALWTDWGSPGDKGPESGSEIAAESCCHCSLSGAVVGGESGGGCGAELEMKGIRIGKQVLIRMWVIFYLWH